MRETTTGSLATALAAHLPREKREALVEMLREAVDHCNRAGADKTGRDARDWQLLLDLELEATRRL